MIIVFSFSNIGCQVGRQSKLLMNLSPHLLLLWSYIQAVGDIVRLEAVAGQWWMSQSGYILLAYSVCGRMLDHIVRSVCYGEGYSLVL